MFWCQYGAMRKMLMSSQLFNPSVAKGWGGDTGGGKIVSVGKFLIDIIFRGLFQFCVHKSVFSPNPGYATTVLRLQIILVTHARRVCKDDYKGGGVSSVCHYLIT